MSRLFGYDTRSCGVDGDALVPINKQLVQWADKIYIMEDWMYLDVDEVVQEWCPKKKIHVMNITNDYKYMDPELCALIQRRYFST